MKTEAKDWVLARAKQLSIIVVGEVALLFSCLLVAKFY